MKNEERVRASFSEQAAYCERLNSIFMRDLLNGLAEHLDHTSQTGFQILNWQGNPEPKEDALALRVAGALHDLARSGDDPALSRYYESPQHSGGSDFIPTVLNAMSEFDDRLWPWLKFAPQTNEVARSSIIFAGLSVVSDRFQLPLSLYEMGCSAGLNLQCAEFQFQFGGAGFGNLHSELTLAPEWSGPLPPDTAVKVSARHGCDLNPLSVTDPTDASKLISYLWPDQYFRIERVKTAIDIARRNPPTLMKATADAWVEYVLSESLQPGNVTVLYNTIAWNYFPQITRDRISAHVNALGSCARNDNPLAWLAFEFDVNDQGPYLTLQTWPGTGQKRVLASADAHVYKVDWN